MALFLLFFIPLSFVLYIFYQRQKGAEAAVLGLHFLWGILSFIPAMVLFLMGRGFGALNYTAVAFYFYYFFYEHFLWLALAIILFMLVKRFILKELEDCPFPLNFAYGCGFYTAVAVFVCLDHINHFNFYLLFLYPLLALATVCGLACFLNLFFHSYGLLRWLSLGAIAILPFLLNLATVLAWRNLWFWSILTTLLLFAGAVVVFFLVGEK